MNEIIKCPHCNGQLPIQGWAIYQRIKELKAEKKRMFEIIDGYIHPDMPRDLKDELKVLEDK